MNNSRYLWLCACLATLAFVVGCRESEPLETLPSLPAKPAERPTDTPYALRLHWIGGARLSTETNATNFMAIWNMPESLRLQNQTLDKLSTAPWRLLLGEINATNAASALLRPLLADIIQNESYLEVRDSTNGAGELVFAIRLEAARVALWDSNLPAVLESLGVEPSGTTSSQRKWTWKQENSVKLLQLAREGDWTVFGISGGQNELFKAVRQRVQDIGAPLSGETTDHWIKAEFKLNDLLNPLGGNWELSGDPHVRMTVAGTGENVRTRAEVKFNRALDLEMEPWILPTNMLIEPLSSFTAVRGIRPWLSAAAFWRNLNVGPPPNHFFAWSSPGIPAQLSLAAPHPDASNLVQNLSAHIARTVNPLLKPGDWGEIEPLPDRPGAHWSRLPFAAPYLTSVWENDAAWTLAGSFMPAESASPMPQGLVQAVVGDDKVLLYDWELTGSKIQTDIYWVQMLRLISDKPQIPDKSAAGAWLLASRERLGNSVTHLLLAAADTIALTRTSPVGLTSIELQVLMDWLESPLFPSGLHTFIATRTEAERPPPVSAEGQE